MPPGTFFFTCQGNSASSCWSILFFTVERKGKKREKFEGNIVRIFGVVFSVEDKNVLSNRQMDRASKRRSLPDLLPKSTGHRLCWSQNAGWGPRIFPCGVQCRVGLLKEPLSTGTCNDIDKATLTINPTLQGHIKQQSIHSGTGSQIGQAFFLFWYEALDLAVIKAMLLFCLIWLSDFQHIFKGCIVPLKREIFLQNTANLNKSGY